MFHYRREVYSRFLEFSRWAELVGKPTRRYVWDGVLQILLSRETGVYKGRGYLFIPIWLGRIGKKKPQGNIIGKGEQRRLLPYSTGIIVKGFHKKKQRRTEYQKKKKRAWTRDRH